MSEIRLNEAQQNAVQDIKGAVLVIAGAGSGKTRVLTARICHLLDLGVSPYNILAITFTNKAAKEMKERIANQIGISGVWTSTFHSMCAQILRVHGKLLGYGDNFTIYAEDDSEKLVKRIIKANPSEYNEKMVKTYLWHISNAKTKALNPDKYYDEIYIDCRNADEIISMYREYDDALFKSNSMDFDDLLLKTVELFTSHREVLETYQERFKYIHVDEFQDTNAIQYDIVKMLSGKHGNLFVVGDEDQSIYSWRGAEIKNILDFPKDFKGAKVYKLEQNYRSNGDILTAANNVIKNNLARNAKNLWSNLSGDSLSVQFYSAADDRDEAARVVQAVRFWHRQGCPYRDMAVLVRANWLTKSVEDGFVMGGIPYKIFGGFKFYDRKEIKDVLSYVRLVINPSDNESLMRIINYPKRSIGKVLQDEIEFSARRSGDTFYGALCDFSWQTAAESKKIKPFVEIIEDLRKVVSEMPPVEFMKFLLKRTGIEDEMLEDMKDEGVFSDSRRGTEITESEARYENVNQLLNSVGEYVKDNPDSNMIDFMQSVSLVSDLDRLNGDDCVNLATIHSVKGLEFENVAIIGLNEGVFPRNEADNMEEERRLMYVAITRAKTHLLVTDARRRMYHGRIEEYIPSRFVSEMKNIRASVRFSGSSYSPSVSPQKERTAPVTLPTFNLGAKKRDDIDYSAYEKGVIVKHVKFGFGEIVKTEGDGADKIVSVAFSGLGTKRFSLLTAAPLMQITGRADD